MGSRKESIKKSLGISEYPWSSDDDENGNQTMPEVHILRRQPSDPRPSVSELPGTSGSVQSSGSHSQSPVSPMSSRRSMGKLDRDLFWSGLSNPQRAPSLGVTSRLRLLNNIASSTPSVPRPLPHTAPSAVGRETSLRSTPVDIQRILAFKKLTRSLSAYRPSKTNLYSTSRAVPLGSPSRSPLFAGRRRSQPRPARTSESIPWNLVPVDPGPGPSSNRHRPRFLSPPPTIKVDQSDDDNDVQPMDLRPDSPVHEPENTTQQNGENNDAETNAAEPTPDTSAGTMTLEEEIVEIDIDPESVPEGDQVVGLEVAVEVTDNSNANEDSIVNVTSNDTAVEVEEQPQGVKRKRSGSEDNGEPFTVKEFNQSLLRVLECPVCLEWMEPPMCQCRRGHLVCAKCRARLAACPVCRTAFSSVRNRAMEAVAEMLRYPCRHGCGREVRLRRRNAHEASCAARRHRCPAPACDSRPPLPRDQLAPHVQSKHMHMLRIGKRHTFALRVSSELHEHWLVLALREMFHVRADVDVRAWAVDLMVAYIGPKKRAKNYSYEVTVTGQDNSRRLVYSRATHSDLESASVNLSRHDCFHVTLDQAINFLRIRNRNCINDKFLDFQVEISEVERDVTVDDSDS